MFKPGDLAQLQWSSFLWEAPWEGGLGVLGPNKSVANKDDIVIIVDFVLGRNYTEVLHPEHRSKWVRTSSLVIFHCE